ncbi:MAG: hypothetical protein HY961_05620 [Ignavibacteriae bacterium]|nr:hypothetical protein [Ignavibacteriota bacterium]
MIQSRGLQKFERVTITLLPTADERSFRHIPSTFSKTNRTYGWRHYEQIDYMIVPKKISSNEIKVDIFVDPQTKKKLQPTDIQRAVTNFVKSKIHSEWAGLKLGNISRATVASPPDQTFHRGTIEEILGTHLEN